MPGHHVVSMKPGTALHFHRRSAASEAGGYAPEPAQSTLAFSISLILNDGLTTPVPRKLHAITATVQHDREPDIARKQVVMEGQLSCHPATGPEPRA
jgi:hypothetical protein